MRSEAIRLEKRNCTNRSHLFQTANLWMQVSWKNFEEWHGIEHAQFMVNMLNLWWTCSIYGEYAEFMVNMVMINDLTSWLYWPCKTTPKLPFECSNLSPRSKDTVIFIFKSADLYSHSLSDLMIGLASENYPKMTLWKSKSIHWIKRYSDIYFYVSWFVQSLLIVPHDRISLEKLPPNDSLSVQICPLD